MAVLGKRLKRFLNHFQFLVASLKQPHSSFCSLFARRVLPEFPFAPLPVAGEVAAVITAALWVIIYQDAVPNVDFVRHNWFVSHVKLPVT